MRHLSQDNDWGRDVIIRGREEYVRNPAEPVWCLPYCNYECAGQVELVWKGHDKQGVRFLKDEALSHHKSKLLSPAKMIVDELRVRGIENG